MRKIIELLVIAIVLLVGLNGFAFAGNKASITVTAVVMPRISQILSHQEARIQITEMDIKRGFIEVPSGTILQVKTNDRKGYGLFLEGGDELFKEVWVIDKGRTTVLSSGGGFVHQPYSGGNIEVKDLSYRFHLREDIQPGIYSFPIRVKASLR